MLKTVVKCKFLGCPSDPLVTSCVSDAQNCGKTQILRLTLATLSSLRACRTLKTVVKCKFWIWPSNPFVTSCVSDAFNCGKNGRFSQLASREPTLPCSRSSRQSIVTWARQVRVDECRRASSKIPLTHILPPLLGTEVPQTTQRLNLS